jgi:hypothetical protein
MGDNHHNQFMLTHPMIRTECTQLGLAVEASLDGKTWITVQLTPYKVRNTPTVRQYSTAINPKQDEVEYFAELDARGVKYSRVR